MTCVCALHNPRETSNSTPRVVPDVRTRMALVPDAAGTRMMVQSCQVNFYLYALPSHLSCFYCLQLAATWTLKTMKRGLLAIAVLLLLGFSAFCTIYANQESVMVELATVSSDQLRSLGGNETRRWASISLCWGGDLINWIKISACIFSCSENAKVYGKEKFPYSEAAYYSSMLWHSQTEGKVSHKHIFHKLVQATKPQAT